MVKCIVSLFWVRKITLAVNWSVWMLTDVLNNLIDELYIYLMMFYIFVTVLFTLLDWNIEMNSTSGVVFIYWLGHTLLHIRQTIKKKLKRQCWVALWFRHWNLNKIVIIAIILLTMRCSDVAWLSSSESFHGG